MGQLSGRLKEILRTHGDDPNAHRSVVDRLASLEADGEAKAAHALFIEAKTAAARRHLSLLQDALRGHPFITDPPRHDVSSWPLDEVEREIRRLSTAIDAAEAIAAALLEARTHEEGLVERAAAGDFASFATIPMAALPQRETDAEALRRRLAREAHVQERYRAVIRRAAKLNARPIKVPDLASAAVPDPDDASATLDRLDALIADAERVDAALHAVERVLRDAAVREHARKDRLRILRAARDASRTGPVEAAVDALRELASEAERTRVEAAAFATKRSRARKRGEAAPEPDRGSGDLQDYYL